MASLVSVILFPLNPRRSGVTVVTVASESDRTYTSENRGHFLENSVNGNSFANIDTSKNMEAYQTLLLQRRNDNKKDADGKRKKQNTTGRKTSTGGKKGDKRKKPKDDKKKKQEGSRRST